MTKFRRARHWLANLIYWQWRKMSLLSGFAYLLLIQNGGGSKQAVEDLEKYLENDHVYLAHLLRRSSNATRRRGLKLLDQAALEAWRELIDEALK